MSFMMPNMLSHKEISRMLSEYIKNRPSLVAVRWRAESFLASDGEPMTIRRAKALNSVLDSCELPVWTGELIIGCGKFHRNSFEEDLSENYEILGKIGARGFCDHADHHAPNYKTLLAIGFGGIKHRIQKSLAKHTEPAKIDFLRSVDIAIDGASRFMQRYADVLDGAQREMMLYLSENPPRSFHEAIQLVYSCHSMMQIDDRYAMAFGRMDQYLYPFYCRDKAAGKLTADAALEILEHLFAKITADDDVQNIAVGGVKPEDGTDASNELSLLILEACKNVGRPGGNVTARIHKGSPHIFVEKCVDVIRTGIGYPAVVNDEVMIPALVDIGTPLEDARDYCFVGCIETSIPGKSAPWADSRFNLLACVNLSVFNGVNSVNGEQLGLQTGEPETWEEFYSAFVEQMRAELKKHVEWIDGMVAPIHARCAEYTSPLMSALTNDCIERGLDLDDSGALYPGNHGVAGMGIGVTSDAMAAVKKYVYDERRFTLADLREILLANFEDYDNERMLLLKGAPKYGNDIAEVDDIAVRITRDFGEELLKYRTLQNGFYWGLMAANVQNIFSGHEVGATPDGRLAFQPLSDAASPTFGRDKGGITSTIRSISKLPYHLCPGGNVVNIKLHPSAINGEAGLKALAALIRACFSLGGEELQLNTVDRKILQEAMEHPQDYENLMVRVSGFSAYYTVLDRSIQEDILARTEHARV